jgi:hypothetical protein
MWKIFCITADEETAEAIVVGRFPSNNGAAFVVTGKMIACSAKCKERNWCFKQYDFPFVSNFGKKPVEL